MYCSFFCMLSNYIHLPCKMQRNVRKRVCWTVLLNSSALNAELGRFCPFSAPRAQGGTHFQLVPLGSSQRYFMGKFSPLTSIKFLPPMPPIQKWSKLFAPEKLMRLEKNWLSTHYYPQCRTWQALPFFCPKGAHIFNLSP